MDLSSNLITKSINHEVNTTFYNSILIHKLFENNSAENLSKDNNMIIDWIYKTLLSKKEGKYDNWIPEINENNWLDKLKNCSSIHAQTEVNLSSYEISGKEISIENETNKKKNNKNGRNFIMEKGGKSYYIH